MGFTVQFQTFCESVMINQSRIHIYLKNSSNRKKFVLYWMQAGQRTTYNHALHYAITLANEHNLPMLVYFQLIPDFPEGNIRHYQFMLEGIREVEASLAAMGIKCVISIDSHRLNRQLIELSQSAFAVVTDVGYLRFQKEWRKIVYEQIDCSFVEVETELIVPVGVASQKEEYAARTFRPRIHKHLDEYLQPFPPVHIKKTGLDIDFPTCDISNFETIFRQLQLDNSVPVSPLFRGGTSEAKSRLNYFIDNKINVYFEESNNPTKNVISHLSPYLHFGQISPLEIALEILYKKPAFSEAFLEQLIVRRELSANFVHYNPHYDSLRSLPEWCLKTLFEHASDKREFLYTLEEFEQAKTHDECWNAAQMEMIKTGKMHNYMRMYWGKKVIEWTKTFKEAYRILIYLNNKYELDGRDANGYAGIAWCFGKHDQAWKERSIFGKIRYMNEKGLRRKFDMDAYIENVQRL
jgi:deoxyribodipyrimidine photo-lyase